jgi:addiction module HigA family antidote
MQEFNSPAAALRHFLEFKGITAYQFSQQTILPQSRISEILSGKRRITAETATVFGDFFGNGAEFWSAIQSSYDIRKSSSDDAKRWDARGDLSLGGWRIRCYVTPDEQRLISESDFLNLFGFKGSTPRRRCADLIDSPYLKSGSMDILRKKLTNPIKLVGPEHEVVYAHEGNILIDYCRALMDIRRIKGLPAWASDFADQAELIVMSVAKVGIAALIDEATGYQSRRNKEALQKLLARYFREEYAAWTKRFPDWFYEEVFRLKGWKWDALSNKRPSVVGKVTKDIVYSRLEAGVVEELERKNPLLENGHRKTKHHQWLSEGVGHPALDTHFYALRGLMRANHDWRKFYHTLQLAFPKRNETVQLELDDYHNEDEE